MKDGKPETLEEALAIIAEQENRLSEKDESLREKDESLREKDKRLQEKEDELIKKIAEIKILNEQLAVRRAQQYHARCEKTSRLMANQPLLFDSEDLGIQTEFSCSEDDSFEFDIEVSETEEKSEQPKKSKAGRKSLSKMNNLPKAVVHIDLTEEEKICLNCGTQMKRVNVERSERLVHVPSYEYIEVVERYVYECPSCVGDNDKPVRKTAKEKRIIEKSITTPELLSSVFMGKYQKHTPYYCQEDAYNWQGIKISRQNMCNWQQQVYKRLLPLKDLMEKEMKKGKLLIFDETPLEVLKVNEEEVRSEYWNEDRYRKKEKDSGGTQKQCYIWAVLGGREHPIHSYNFRWTRSGKNVIPFLEGFEGNVIQSDGYAGYDSAVDFWNENHPDHKITLCNCNIHARRYFADSVKATKSPTAKEAIKIYEGIFKSEKELREKFRNGKISEEQYLELRQKKVKPQFDYFNKWLVAKSEKEGILGSAKTSEAINYCLNRWDKLTNFLNYAFVTPDTNSVERAVKPFVTARKNFLFSGSGIGAESSCFIFTLIETAKANGVNPGEYLRCLFEQAPYAESEKDWERLLPWNIEITPYKIRGEWLELSQ